MKIKVENIIANFKTGKRSFPKVLLAMVVSLSPVVSVSLAKADVVFMEIKDSGTLNRTDAYLARNSAELNARVEEQRKAQASGRNGRTATEVLRCSSRGYFATVNAGGRTTADKWWGGVCGAKTMEEAIKIAFAECAKKAPGPCDRQRITTLDVTLDDGSGEWTTNISCIYGENVVPEPSNAGKTYKCPAL